MTHLPSIPFFSALIDSPQTPNDMDWSVHYPQYFDARNIAAWVLWVELSAQEQNKKASK